MKPIKYAGFTIIELMLTIVIGAILLAVAIPSYTNMVLNNCLTTKANTLVSAMQLARSTAVTFRDDVLVGAAACRIDTTDNDAPNGACNNADDFGDGVVVYRDIDGDGLADETLEDLNGDGLLQPGEDINGNGVLDNEIIRRVDFTCDASIDETTNQTAVTYTANGSAENAITLNICDTRAAGTYNGRQVTLVATGRPHTNSTFNCP